MKKIICLFIVLSMLFVFVGCGNNKATDKDNMSNEELHFSSNSISIEVGKETYLKAICPGWWEELPIEEKKIQWNSSDDSIISYRVSKSMVPNLVRLKGLKIGRAVLTANILTENKASITINVVAPPAIPVKLESKLDIINIKKGENADYPFTLKDNLEIVSINPEIANIDKTTGKIIAKKEGITYIKATKGEETVQVKVAVSNEFSNQLIISDKKDDRINYYGRTAFDSTNNSQMFYFSASGFDVTFYGTELKAELNSIINNTPPYLSVYVDDENRNEGAKNVIKLVSSGKKEYNLVSGLDKGWHTIYVRKRTAFQRGDSEMNSFGLVKLVTDSDGKIGYTKDKPELNIHFYGDSISCGYGNLADGTSMTSDNTDANLAYHSILCNNIGAQASVMAASGWGVYMGYGKNTQWSWAEKYDKLHTKSNQKIDVSGADIIVINLGTNDASAGVFDNDVDTNKFKNSYVKMLKGLREVNPNSWIFCAYGAMGCHEGCSNAINEVVNLVNDNKIKYIKHKQVSSNHPTILGHKDIAKELEEIFKKEGII